MHLEIGFLDKDIGPGVPDQRGLGDLLSSSQHKEMQKIKRLPAQLDLAIFLHQDPLAGDEPEGPECECNPHGLGAIHNDGPL